MRSWLSVKLIDLVAVAREFPDVVEGLRLAMGVEDAVGAVHVVCALDGEPGDRERFVAELALVADDLEDVLPDVFEALVSGDRLGLPSMPAARTAAPVGRMPSPAPDGPGH